VIESTYGDRYHEAERPDFIRILAETLQRTFDRGGNVVIPSFAVGRTQELLYYIRTIKDAGMVKGHDGFPVYMDSPLANEATGVFLQCDLSCFDEETVGIIKQGINPLWFRDLRMAVSTEDSKAINADPTPKVIISASGMCEAGRIRHHLKHNLWKKECTILFAGYQAVGTLGRSIEDGARTVKLFGEEVQVEAEILHLPGVSGHADKQGLLDWLAGFEKKPLRVFVNHGDNEVCEAFRECLTTEYGYNAYAPYSGTEFDLATGNILFETHAIPLKRKTASGRKVTAHTRLLDAVSRLLAVAQACEGMSNKDLGKFMSQIDSLCDKWRREE
jgi:metallo-beta-lactamase family protein